jgi:hypothetical protein
MPKIKQFSIGAITIVIVFISFSCSKQETKRNKVLTFLFTDPYPEIASTVIDPASNIVNASSESGDSYDMKIDVNTNKIYTSYGSYIGMDNVGAFHTGKTIYLLYNYSQLSSSIEIDPSRNRIYWVDNYSKKIFMGSLDGTLAPTALFGNNPVASGYMTCTSLALDRKNNVLYISDSTLKTIITGDLNNPQSAPTPFLNSSNTIIKMPVDIAISNDGTQLFWIDKQQNGVLVTDTKTKDTSTLYSSGYSEHLYYDAAASDLYWSHPLGITKANLNSTSWKQILQASNIVDFVVN